MLVPVGLCVSCLRMIRGFRSVFSGISRFAARFVWIGVDII